jgi:hypothetical protein
MLIYSRKLRFFACFCLASAASPTFFNSLLAGYRAGRLRQGQPGLGDWQTGWLL